MTLDQQLLLFIAERMEIINLRLETWESLLNWLIVAGLAASIACGLLLWGHVRAGRTGGMLQ